MSGQNQQIVIQQAPGTSGLAITGLIFSILGWFTCGLLCIPGAFFSFLGLLSRGPKGTAIAGLIVGFPGTLFFLFIGMGIIAGFLGLGAATTDALTSIDSYDTSPPVASEPEDTIVETSMPDEIEVDETATVPEMNDEPTSTTNDAGSVATPEATEPQETQIEERHRLAQEKYDEQQRAIAEAEKAIKEAARWRTWTDASGGFTVVAEFKSATGGKVHLLTKDGRDISLELSQLSAADQTFLKERARRKTYRQRLNEEQAKTPPVRPTPPEPARNAPSPRNLGITKAGYQQLQNGMSYRQVVGIIGSAGEELSRNSIEGVSGVMKSVETVMYMWKNSDGSNMNVMFQNDKLMQKAQFGLK